MMNSNSNSISKKSTKTTKVVMFPWLGYGHISPFLELAHKITSHNDRFKVYLVSTIATLSSVEHKVLDRSIKLLPILLPATPDLPRSLHTTNGLPPSLMPSLKTAMNSPDTISKFSEILSDLKPDLIIYDFLQPWLPALARDLSIPAVQFVTSSCTMASLMCHYFKNPAGDLPYPFPEIRFRDYESRELEKMLECAKHPTDRDMVFRGIEESCGIVLVKGFRAMEGPYMDYAGSLLGKRIVPVGPLVEFPDPKKSSSDRQGSEILSWLDSKERKSTVLVSFGSEYFLSRSDMDEIALGLELSGVNFIWVVRFPKDSGLNGHALVRSLPEGFLERARRSGRGRVVEGWAPQAKILCHENIGGFVSHCGWNSVMESVTFGVPVVALPMHLDQPVNARLVENAGVGVEVLREADGRLRGEVLAEAVRLVVVEEGGEGVRWAAAAMLAGLAAKKDEEIDDVVRELTGLLGKN
ncbi:UDP-glycosyltransferase 1 [Striga asiatica]|uniref:Glycosyltransferase n=1 Tax=Striga asiatica TaxID=4170 RepID=A0A5A7NZB8_STRAF|nr:UDP-glycosyltransferase 1 [Striga asiatica]